AAVERVAWLPTRAAERTVVPALTKAALIDSRLVSLGKVTSRAAPSKARSGTAMKSVSADSAFAGPTPQPETRTLHTAASVAIASAATRESTNTGKAAG